MDQIIQYDRNDYHETTNGNRVAKKQYIKGSEQISLVGRCIIMKDIVIRGDLCKIQIGRYTVIHENVILKPSYQYNYTSTSPKKKIIKFLPISIGDYVSIQAGSIVQALKIGSYTSVGRNCTLSHRCQIGENCIILDDSIVPPDAIVAPNSVYGGRPAILVEETPESASMIQKYKMIAFYQNFQPK